MDDRIEGAAQHVKGSIKEALGMLIGDPGMQAEGAAEKDAGAKQAGMDRTRSSGVTHPEP